MVETEGAAPIKPDELLYRRLPVTTRWFDGTNVSPEAFRPREYDQNGISIDRAAYFENIQEAARGQSKGGYYVAVLRAGDLLAQGFVLEPNPLETRPGHVLVTSLTSADRRSRDGLEKMTLLASELCLRVEGPFYTVKPD